MKNLLKLGKALNKVEQKSIKGYGVLRCKTDSDCSFIPLSTCNNGFCD